MFKKRNKIKNMKSAGTEYFRKEFIYMIYIWCSESIRVKYIEFNILIHWNDYIDLCYIIDLRKYATYYSKHEKNIEQSHKSDTTIYIFSNYSYRYFQ